MCADRQIEKDQKICLEKGDEIATVLETIDFLVKILFLTPIV